MAARPAAAPDPGALQLLSLASPWWLFGLALLPVIRWLHRGGRHRRAVPVSHLGLWRGAAASSPAAGDRQPPDPAWRRRALLAFLVFLALAEPQWPHQRARVTLWIDDSLSMLTREPQGTRLVLGWAQARSLLVGFGPADVEVRTLGEPWRSHGAASEQALATIVASAGEREPSAPPLALLRRHGANWLVTDGADASLFEWPEGRRPDRVIQVAGVDRNVGLERLSARRNPDDPQKFDLQLAVANGGSKAETRTVVVANEAGEIERQTLSIEPGASARLGISIPASTLARAVLEPADALAEDDVILLDLGPLRQRRVAVDSRCPAALVAAVTAHPALAETPHASATDVQAVLACGTLDGIGTRASIHVWADRLPTPLPGALLWSSSVPESRRVGLDARRLRIAARIQHRPDDAVLLAAGDEPLIVSRAGRVKRIETSLDFGAGADTPGPEIPLLVNLMFEHLFGSRLLDEIAATDRGRGSARVTGSARTSSDAGAILPGPSSRLDTAVVPLLAAAMIVLLWEVVALGRQWLRLTGRSRAASA